MKTMACLLLCVVLVFIGCSKSDDLPLGNNDDLQLKSAETRTMTFSYPCSSSNEYFTPVICNEDTVDFLVGDGESLWAYAKVHYVNGILEWAIVSVKGSLKSQFTGETFNINELNKVSFNENGEIIDNNSRTHARGDNGTHVIMFLEVDFDNQMYVLTKGICVPSN